MANIKEAPLVSNTANRTTLRGQEHCKQDISLYAPQGQDGQGFQGLFNPTASTTRYASPSKPQGVRALFGADYCPTLPHSESYGALCPSLIIRKAILASALTTAVEEALQGEG